MGLFRDVAITTSGPVAVRHSTVVSKVDSPGNDKAHLTVTALLKNAARHPVKGTLKGVIENTEFSQEIELGPGESRDVTFSPDQFPQLNFDHPRLWWPAQMGKPELYTLRLEFDLDGKASDRSETRFGIREVKSEVLSANRRLFSINGKNILIRGGGWSPDMMLREDPQRLRDQFRYVQDMGLNTIRLEGKLETKEFLDLADERGILLIAELVLRDEEAFAIGEVEELFRSPACLRAESLFRPCPARRNFAQEAARVVLGRSSMSGLPAAATDQDLDCR